MRLLAGTIKPLRSLQLLCLMLLICACDNATTNPVTDLMIDPSALRLAALQKPRIALLDIAARNGESNSSTVALEQALRIVGIPYLITKDIPTALDAVMVVTSSYLQSSTLTVSEKNSLKWYIAAGGILVTAGINDPSLFAVFGLSGLKKLDTRYQMTWNMASADPALRWIDEANEQTISLGRASKIHVMASKGYVLGSASALAWFDDGSVAVSKQAYGNGYAYNLGFSYTDLILRNQLNSDYNAQRTYSNGFEPTTDTIMLFLRGIYQSHVPYATWKYTSPAGSAATLILTHDICDTSAAQMSPRFADFEFNRGISATYNITTHIFNDFIFADFYTPYIENFRYLVVKNHKIGSHSFGHFPDFHQRLVFPEGQIGNNVNNYQPYYNGKETIGGTVFGEVELSKGILEADLGISVRTFRSGHLLFNDKQINAEDAVGYSYDSSNSANDVLSNFPYLTTYDRSFNGQMSRIYELPMTISDKDMTADNYQQMVDLWQEIIMKNAANHAPSVLLIHPNYDYKLQAEETLLTSLPAEILVSSMESYGDYWRERDRFTFDTRLVGTTLTVIIPAKLFPLDARLSIVIDNGQNLETLRVITDGNDQVAYQRLAAGQNDLIISAFGQIGQN